MTSIVSWSLKKISARTIILVFSDSENLSPSIMQHVQSAVPNHKRIIERNSNLSELCFFKLLYVIKRRAVLSAGVKATKNLILFKSSFRNRVVNITIMFILRA